MATHWTRSNHVVWEELNGEMVLVDASNGCAWVLNATAAQIWKGCERKNADQIAQNFVCSGTAQMRQIKKDIRAFIERLIENGWLRPAVCHAANIESCGSIALRSDYVAPAFEARGLAGGPRRRPSPRGNSGPG